jgi:hypothetical protein
LHRIRASANAIPARPLPNHHSANPMHLQWVVDERQETKMTPSQFGTLRILKWPEMELMARGCGLK